MQIFNGVEEVPHLDGAVVTIGMFAGMHRGHRAVLARTVERARMMGLRSVAMTFTPHPVLVHHPDRYIQPLSSVSQRLDALESQGIDATLLVNYTLEFAALTPEEFVRTHLVELLSARAVVVGEDARFGVGNSGDIATLRELGATYAFEVDVVEDLVDPTSGRRWSSTWIREALADGDVEAAAYILGRPHLVRVEVVHGAHRGRELGYPTANLKAEDVGVVPIDGVYAGWLTDGDVRYPAAISVGTNPTFGDESRTVEAHVLGRDDLDLYGHLVTVEFTHRLRPMHAFDGIEPLLVQMRQDVIETARHLGEPVPLPPCEDAHAR